MQFKTREKYVNDIHCCENPSNEANSWDGTTTTCCGRQVIPDRSTYPSRMILIDEDELKTKVDKIWELLACGKEVYWHHSEYKVFAEECGNSDFQKNHFTLRNGKILIQRHTNGSQGLLTGVCLSNLYIKLFD